MKTVKRLLMSMVMVAVLVLPAFAEVGITDLGVTNKFTANYTTVANVSSNSVYLPKTTDVGLELQIQGDAAGTGLITMTFARSYDGIAWETTPRFTWQVPLNGTTAVVGVTNIAASTIQSAAYLKCVSIANADATANATNCVLRVVRKTIKPSP